MIQIQPPRFSGTYDIISSYEPDLDRPEIPDRLDNESDEDYRRRVQEALLPFNRRLVVARETGDWSAVLKPGANPTKFRVRRIPGRRWEAFDTFIQAANLTDFGRASLLIRMAIVSIDQWVPGFVIGSQVEHVDNLGRPTGIGPVASVDVIESFFAARPGEEAIDMIVDLGTCIYKHRMVASGN